MTQCCAVIAPGCPPQQLERRTSLRKQLVEPVFGIIKEQQGARRFLLRGLVNVAAEWTMLATAFNLRTSWRVWRSAPSSVYLMARSLVPLLLDLQ